MPPALDLNDLALFVQVVRAGSFAEAGRRAGLPANTVSRRIQQLEARLGSRLLQRSTRQLTLTDAGERLHERCAASVEALVEAGQVSTRDGGEPSGRVRVGATADFFDFFPMDCVAGFLARHPAVRLDFVLSDAQADLIGERIDVAIRAGPLQDSNHVGRELVGPGSQGLVASPAYLAARGAPAALQDLVHHDCVAFAHPSGRATWRLSRPDGVSEAVQVSGRFAANTAQALRKAALAGLGIALLPPALSRADLEASRLRPVLPDYQRIDHGLHLLYPSRRQLSPAVAAWIEWVMARQND